MHQLQPIYQNFSVTVDPKEYKNNNGHLAHLGLHLPQNTAGNWNDLCIVPYPDMIFICTFKDITFTLANIFSNF